ncbi:hypothetical protein HO173_007316 [Letharia columbiana]|uniref:Uncharacterized protein n=1 Tax=Letharia columbiana TaxID=112416 RepID=A0A8H6FU07_9LECA|nr:uncharacterized protein HO173_007316 [Letharia columbiana]KAF6234690.1 hypothetical protein HO173_007316 [Letharia columbiana]
MDQLFTRYRHFLSTVVRSSAAYTYYQCHISFRISIGLWNGSGRGSYQHRQKKNYTLEAQDDAIKIPMALAILEVNPDLSYGDGMVHTPTEQAKGPDFTQWTSVTLKPCQCFEGYTGQAGVDTGSQSRLVAPSSRV